VANAFNLVSKGVIFQKLHAANGDIVRLILFVHAFDAFEFPLFYNHRNREGDVTVIMSPMQTRQGDPLWGALFSVTHYIALCVL
jgi:hypothetical protein